MRAGSVTLGGLAFPQDSHSYCPISSIASLCSKDRMDGQPVIGLRSLSRTEFNSSEKVSAFFNTLASHRTGSNCIFGNPSLDHPECSPSRNFGLNDRKEHQCHEQTLILDDRMAKSRNFRLIYSTLPFTLPTQCLLGRALQRASRT